MNKTLKIIFFVVIALALGFFLFQRQSNGSRANGSGLVSEGNQIAVTTNPNEIPSVISQEEISGFASLLSILQSVSLDTTLFSKKSFMSLKDNTVDLGDTLVGRSNPFMKVGEETEGVKLSQLNSQSLTIETVQPDPKTITKESAEFSAFVEFEGTIPVDVVFQYNKEGEDPKLTNPLRITSSGFVKTTVTNLQKDTTYTVSSVGTRGSNRQVGSAMVFTTKP